MKIEKNIILATVLSGKYTDETVGIMVEFTDGDCIADLGSTHNNELITIHISKLAKWKKAKSVAWNNEKSEFDIDYLLETNLRETCQQKFDSLPESALDDLSDYLDELIASLDR
jgi:hypothetical protein